MKNRLEILRRAGEALYGERWQAPLSRDLGVTARTVRNWAAERNDCPDDVPQRLLPILRARGESVAKLATIIEQSLSAGSIDQTDRHARKRD